MLVCLVTGCRWEDADRLCANKVSDTTVLARRDEWIDAGMFDGVVTETCLRYPDKWFRACSMRFASLSKALS